MNKLLDTVWTIEVLDGGFYLIQPSEMCKPEDHGKLNPRILRITDEDGDSIWERAKQ